MNEFADFINKRLAEDDKLRASTALALTSDNDLKNFVYGISEEKELPTTFDIYLTKIQMMVNLCDGESTFIGANIPIKTSEDVENYIKNGGEIVNKYAIDSAYSAAIHAMAGTYCTETSVLPWIGFDISNILVFITVESDTTPIFIFAYFPKIEKYLIIHKNINEEDCEFHENS